jgi:hypothetical protein
MAKAWDDMKRTAQSAFNDVANSYQAILIRGHLMPNRNIERDIAEGEYQLDRAEYDRYLDQSKKDIPDPEPEPPEPDIEPEV